jgi:hypothetical protein
MYNDTKTIYNKRLYVGVKNTGKKMYVDLTINQEAETRTAQTTTGHFITGYKTLSMSGTNGQNRKETADINNYKELFISKEDLQTINRVWANWHLNDMHIGTERQEEFLKQWKKEHKYDYTAACEALKEVGLYEDNGHKYGHAWLVKPLPEEVITEIISIFENYNKPEHIEQQSNRAKFKQFKIKASYKGNKKASWGDNWNNHMVTVTNIETGQKITFEFWASIANPELKTEYDLLNAFYCFVSDAIAGSYTFEEFCSEFGYNNDSDSRQAEKIYRKCKKQLEKLKKIYDGDIYELANKLQKVAD